MPPTSTLAEHSDVLLYMLFGLITFVGVLLKRWDTNHTKALVSLVSDIKELSAQVLNLQRDFYELRGEHRAHHKRRETDLPFDDQGFRHRYHGEGE